MPTNTASPCVARLDPGRELKGGTLHDCRGVNAIVLGAKVLLVFTAT